MLQTASEIISFAKKLENESASFYEGLAKRFNNVAETLLSFAHENGKFIKQIERVYYGVISDALEGCFAFKINTDDYSFKVTLSNSDSHADALSKAIYMEEQMVKFYLNASEQSAGLLADIPRNFEMIAEKKNRRIAKLQHLIGDRE